MARATGSYPVGRGFDSLRSHDAGSSSGRYFSLRCRLAGRTRDSDSLYGGSNPPTASQAHVGSISDILRAVCCAVPGGSTIRRGPRSASVYCGVAQWKSAWLLTRWSQVRSLPLQRSDGAPSRFIARRARLAEHLFRKQTVPGSTPGVGSAEWRSGSARGSCPRGRWFKSTLRNDWSGSSVGRAAR